MVRRESGHPTSTPSSHTHEKNVLELTDNLHLIPRTPFDSESTEQLKRLLLMVEVK